MDWSEVTARVVIEAAAAHPQDVVLDLGGGEGTIALALAPHVREVVVVDRDADALARLRAKAPANIRLLQGDMRQPPKVPGVSVVILHDALRYLTPAEQAALFQTLGRMLPPRALLVVGDVMWSMPLAMVDEPAQFGPDITHAPTTQQIEKWSRDAGFLPDLHRFGVGRAVLIALKGDAE